MSTILKDPRESGNVLFYILIAIALLGALTFAITRQGGDSLEISEEKSKVLATEFLEYSNMVANAFGQLRLRGCDLDDMNFDHSDLTGYDNSSAPSDGTCDIYALAGGGLEYVPPPYAAMTGVTPSTNHWNFYADTEIEDVGTTCGSSSCSDLIIVAANIRQSVCEAINEHLGVRMTSSAVPTDTAFGTTKFTGSMDYNVTVGDEDSNLETKRAACVNAGGGTYTFYKVLHVQ